MRNKIFEKIPVTIPNRSGFDLSHENRGTAKVGILVPVMTREMQGHDSLSVNLGSQIQFAPFATDFYGRIKVYFEAFFVPYRIIDGHYKDLYRYALSSLQGDGTGPLDISNNNPYFEGLRVYPLSPDAALDEGGSYPKLTSEMTADPSVGLIGPGTLLDYLGVKTWPIVVSGQTDNPPYLTLPNRHRLDAYHRIYEEYYMDSRVQKHAYVRWTNYGGSQTNQQMSMTIPYRGTPYNSGNPYILRDGPLNDGVYLTGLRSRNYAKDYFTTATPDPQFGGELGVEADANGRITISQIRVANALQQFVELHNKVGTHYDDLAFAETGIRPSDAAVDIPIYLGRQVYDVYNKSVYQTGYDISQFDGPYYDPNGNNANPFESVGAKYSNGQALGSGHLCDFTATEGGIFMVLMSVAPDASYGSGNTRQWDYQTIFDLPTPHLQGIGDQPIYKGELAAQITALTPGGVNFALFDHNEIFGYTQRFAEAKFMLDETHGLLQDTRSLSAFALKRSFVDADDVALGKDFLTVPIDALDEVSAIRADVDGRSNPQSAFGYWFDIYFDVKLVSNLSAYSIPTLEDMKGHTEMVDNAGRRL